MVWHKKRYIPALPKSLVSESVVIGLPLCLWSRLADHLHITIFSHLDPGSGPRDPSSEPVFTSEGCLNPWGNVIQGNYWWLSSGAFSKNQKCAGIPWPVVCPPPKKVSLRSRTLRLGCDFNQDDMELGTIRWRGITASFMIQRSWTIHQVPSFSFTESIGVLHGTLVVTYSLQAKNLSIIGCLSLASLLRESWFQLGKWVGSQGVMTNGSAQCAHPRVP